MGHSCLVLLPYNFNACTLPFEGTIRLVGGASVYEGRLEIFHDNVWGTDEAKVTCRQLGYSTL